MKNIVSININSYCPISKAFSYQERAKLISEYITKEYYPSVIALQEVYSSKIDLISKAFPQYSVFSPIGNFGPRTLMSIILVRNDLISSTRAIALPSHCRLKNRLNCVQIVLINGFAFTVINVYSVAKTGRTSAYFPRLELYENTWNILHQLVCTEARQNRPCIVLGDLEEGSNSHKVVSLKETGQLKEFVNNLPTAYNAKLHNAPVNIDHIMLNKAFTERYKVNSLGVDGAFRSLGLSDHSILSLNIEER